MLLLPMRRVIVELPIANPRGARRSCRSRPGAASSQSHDAQDLSGPGQVRFADAREVVMFDIARDARLSPLRKRRSRRAPVLMEASPNDLQAILNALAARGERLVGDRRPHFVEGRSRGGACW